MSELLLGCGRRRDKQLRLPSQDSLKFTDLTTLDVNPLYEPDILWDLTKLPWPIEADSFDECHAYDVLEHLGRQGDYYSFFEHFTEIWRLLKPGGHLFAIVPTWNSIWAWGDPGHTRIINPGSLTFLSQEEYRKQAGVTPMSDYRWCYQADFSVVGCQTEGDRLYFILQAIKPARLK